jgi:AbrB family looped-hinge helix DNA binding protein
LAEIKRRPYIARGALNGTNAMNAVGGRVFESGRISLPAEFRKSLGLEHGGNVVLELADRTIRIRPLDEVIAQAQALARRLLGDGPEAGVDAFLAEPRTEVARE